MRSFFGRIIMFIVVASILIAVLRLLPWQHPAEIIPTLHTWGTNFSNWLKSVGNAIGLNKEGIPTPTSSTPAPNP